MITVTRLSKSYGSKEVLRDISLTFQSGEVYGIVGQNGAGKTTLFNCIAGLTPYRGEITSPYSPLKNHLGYLQTEPHFFNLITGREYLQLFLNAGNIKEVDIDDKNLFDLPLDQYASTYSTGMKKKLAINAILIQGNDIFILDEPFNGVDIESNIIIVEIIRKLKTLNKVIIISSHIFSTLMETCDIIHVLKGGVIAETASRTAFAAMESDMRAVSIGDRVERMQLR